MRKMGKLTLKRLMIFILIIISSIIASIMLILKMAWSFACDWENRIDASVNEDLKNDFKN
jgi:hypothetical protein